MEKRATTLAAKKKILIRLYRIWKDNPDLRLGQLLTNAFEGKQFRNPKTGDFYHDMCLYYKEDHPFIEYLEDFYSEERLLN